MWVLLLQKDTFLVLNLYLFCELFFSFYQHTYNNNTLISQTNLTLHLFNFINQQKSLQHRVRSRLTTLLCDFKLITIMFACFTVKRRTCVFLLISMLHWFLSLISLTVYLLDRKYIQSICRVEVKYMWLSNVQDAKLCSLGIWAFFRNYTNKLKLLLIQLRHKYDKCHSFSHQYL